MNQTLSTVEDMLAHFVCAEGDGDSYSEFGRFNLPKRPGVFRSMAIDIGSKLKFESRFPTVAYTAAIGESRDFAINPELLLNSVQDIIGDHVEVALVDQDHINWNCVRRIYKRPRGVFVASPGCDLYEQHGRTIFNNGLSSYKKSIIGISKSGKHVSVNVEGSRDQVGGDSGKLLTLLASLIEDSSRKDTFKCTIKDSVGIIFPVRQGEHLDIFKLRDGPKTGDRKRPLLHWVASHLKSNQTKIWEVKEYLRGVHDFDIDGMNVKLEGLI